jgi:hypothetical protein
MLKIKEVGKMKSVALALFGCALCAAMQLMVLWLLFVGC